MARSCAALLLICSTAALAVAEAASYGGYGYGYGSPYGSYGYSSPPPASSGSSTCSVTAYVANPWPLWSSKTTYADSINLIITNLGSSPITQPWYLQITNPAYKSIEQSAWNWDYLNVSSDGTITGKAEQDWETLSANQGNSVNVGAIVGANSNATSDYAPVSATLNSSPCTLKVVTN